VSIAGILSPAWARLAPEISVIILGAKQDGDIGDSELIMITITICDRAPDVSVAYLG
jgi:hypothetical protein